MLTVYCIYKPVAQGTPLTLVFVRFVLAGLHIQCMAIPANYHVGNPRFTMTSQSLQFSQLANRETFLPIRD